jgi:hypothetical protein
MQDAAVATVGVPDVATAPVMPPQDVTVVQPQTVDDGRPRDSQGRFVTPEPVQQGVTGQAAAPSLAVKFSQPLLDAARSVMLTDDQISSFNDPSLLFDVVRGRAASMQRQPATVQPVQPQYQPVVPAPAVEQPLPDFNLTLPEGELDPALVKTLKDLTAYANALKATVAKKLETIEGKNKTIEQTLQATAQSAAVAQQSEQARFWDEVASSIPGMVQAIGRPSVVSRSPQSAQGTAWAEVAPLIIARGQAQNVPPDFIDYQRAAAEAWDLYQHLGRNRNGAAGNGQNGPNLPGQTIRGTSRQGTAAPSNRELSPQEDYNQRLAAFTEAWIAHNNQNPLLG